MASIEVRKHPKTKAVMSYRVTWREAGEKQWDTVGTKADALRLQGHVEAAGNRWPAGWVKGKGFESMYRAEADRPEASALAASVTFGQAVQEHLDGRHNHRMQPQSVEQVRRMMERHAVPLWDLPVETIRTTDVQAVMDAMGHNHAGETVRAFRTYTVATFKSYMAARGLEMVNPGDRTHVNAQASTVVARGLERWELDALLSGFSRADDRLYVKLLAYTGMRPGEVRALRVGDVDLTGKRPAIKVNKTVKRGGTVGKTKTEGSTRAVSLNSELVEELAAYVEGKSPAERLFVGKAGSTWFARWKKAKAHAGFSGQTEARLYDMRHSHATWLMEDGIPLAVVSDRLGHSNLETTKRYTHLGRTDLDAKAAETMNRNRAVNG